MINETLSAPAGNSGWILRYQHYFLVAAVAACMMLPGLGIPEIVDADEGQRAVPPMEMLRSGDWVVPRLNGQPYLKKPALLYWIIAPLYKLFGQSELVARLPTATSCILLSVLVYHWTLRLASRRAALLAGLIASCNLAMVLNARMSMLDTPLALFTCAAMYCWWRALDAGKDSPGQETRYFILGSLWLAGANLLKIPVPFGFLLSAWFCAALWTRRWSIALNWKAWTAVLFSLVPVTVWAFAVVARVGWEDATATWRHEVHGHYATATSINSGPIWFYLVRIIACFLPWVAGLWFLRSRWAERSLRQDRLATGFFVGGAILSFLILSVVPAKETFYMLSLVPLLSILFAVGIDAAFRNASARTFRFALTGVCATYILLTCAVAVPHQVKKNRKISLKAIAAAIEDARSQGRTLAIHGFTSQPALYFYLKGLLPDLKRDEVSAYLDQPGHLLVVQDKRADKVAGAYSIIARGGDHGDVMLVERKR